MKLEKSSIDHSERTLLQRAATQTLRQIKPTRIRARSATLISIQRILRDDISILRVRLADSFRGQYTVDFWPGDDILADNFDLDGLEDDDLSTEDFVPMLDGEVLKPEKWFNDDDVLDYNCTCTRRKGFNIPCEHVAAGLSLVLEQMNRPVDELLWLKSIVVNPMDLGSQWWQQVETLLKRNVNSVTETKETRISWRLNPLELRRLCLEAVEQTAKVNGGWSKGRTVAAYALTERLDKVTDLTQRDLLRLASNPYGNSIIEACQLLRDKQVLWSGPTNDIELTVSESQLRLRILDGAEGRAIALMMDDLSLSSNKAKAPVFSCTNNPFGVIVADLESLRLLYAPCAREVLPLVDNFLKFSRKGTMVLGDVTAEQMVAAVSNLERFLPVELPASLAGVECPVELRPLLLLNRATTQGLDVSLRVQPTDGIGEYYPPGMEPQRVRGMTLDGPVQWLRDLASERTSAELIVTQLEMGRYDFSGPYEWKIATDEQALELLDRVQELGDNAPEIRWNSETGKLRVLGEITPKSLKIEISDHRDWFGIEGKVKVGDLEIPLVTLLTALRTGQKFVSLGAGQFAKISASLRKRLTTLADAAPQDRNTLHVARAAAPLVEEILGKDIPLQAAKQWRDSLKKLESIRRKTPKLPSGFKAELRDYQLAGFQWLSRLSQWGVGGCLADDMGLGKTVQALAVLQQRASGGPALIVAPTSVGDNWVRECERFSPKLKPKLYREHDRDSVLTDAGAKDLVIVSYQMLRRNSENFAAKEWHTLVLDEAQFIKNAATKTATAVRGLSADWRLALTGTPMENHLGELWSLYRTVSPGLLGSWDRFRRDFGDPIQKHQDADRREAMSNILRPFLLRRTKGNVLKELPARTEIVLNATLSSAERKRYDAARIAAIAELTGIGGRDGETDAQKRVRILSWLMKLRQLSCHPKLVDAGWKKSSAKLDLFLETVSELREEGHRALVFSQFVKHLDIVRAALDKQKISYQYLDGATPARERQKRVDAFQQGEGDLFLISLKAGGTGLNLTAADYVIHLDPWWNPAVEDQATDRAHRMGQTRPVTVYRLVTADSIEEQIIELHKSKRELVASVLDGADQAAKLSTDELISLIRGRPKVEGIVLNSFSG